ncbi:uncharacterized protein LOC122247113 isoform X3 [Penaeus japonicus]|uniref:uncharacterized protein LOC122247113 isoform X3 n=1 Tax=Penaeus japonicus TaxID=27405 RepID=UPI001C7151EA|nr:uncharacterized protein LOC122247113 isoform X3 [Penaeus japonicus]
MENYVKKLDVKSIQKALQSGKRVDADLDGKGVTALHLAAGLTDEADCITVAEVLLAHRANPNIQNNYGQSSLHVAATHGYSRLLELLLVNGGDPLLGDITGRSPVDYAYEKRQTEVVEQLNELLNSENYECPQENKEKFVMAFWRQEIVELPVLSQEGSEVSCQSWDLPGSQEQVCLGTEKEKTAGMKSDCKKDITHDPYMEESFSTRYSQFLRDLENYDHQQMDTDDDGWKLSLTREPKLDKSKQPEIHCPDFLKKLKQTIQKCQHDSDSDNDISSLQRCLEKNLDEANRSYCRASSFASFTSEDSQGLYSEQTLNELDIAQLTIDLTDNLSILTDDLFEATYIPPNKSINLVEKPHKSVFAEGCITLNSLAEDGETLIDDSDCSDTLTDSVIIVAEKNKKNLKGNIDRVTGKNPEQVIKCIEEKAREFSTITTAPRNTSKPDHCRTMNLVKAPRKEVPYLERCARDKPPLRDPSSKLFDGLTKTLTPKSKSSGMNPPSATFSSPKRATQLTSVPSTPRSHQGHVGKGAPSTSSSCQSFFSVVEEFLYEDPEAGIALIERRCPTSSSIASTGSQMGSLPRSLIQSKKITETLRPQQDKANVCFEESSNSIGTVTDSIKALSVETLRARLKAIGYTAGPITAGTHRVYQRHLMRIRKNPQMLEEQDAESAKPSYPRELKMALEDPSSVDWISWGSLERVMSSPFCQPDPMRHWRDGTTKACFNYLLLDPRITQDLPLRGLMMTDAERFQCFISAIFYIGKGSRGRPYYHLYEAIKSLESGKKKNKKIERIHDIWSEGVGVVSLHVFQNTIPVEAWTREAAMITAIGLGNLSNSIQGTFYGLPSTWRWAERRRLGTHLLWRTLQIFLQEGERQLRPSDVTLPAWMK